jgi:hypothetical protein
LLFLELWFESYDFTKFQQKSDSISILNYMNDLIQSLPSPSPTMGITHTWMGESWMVDGETLVMMVMKISSKSLSR